jgi:hypothetical protein
MSASRPWMATIEPVDEPAAFVFGRDRELEELGRRLSIRKSFVLYGASGAGKTYLVRRVIRDFPEVLYCPNSDSPQLVFQSLALALLAARDRAARASLRNEGVVKTKSTISLRGVVLDAVRTGKYWVVLDHLRGPAAALSSDTRDLMFYGGTPVLAVARSAHMEDLGFLTPMFALRAERMRLANFAPAEAGLFAEQIAHRLGIRATNLPEFLQRIVDLSQGSPGAIERMIHMAMLPKYRINGHIKTSPLYIDFRLAWHAENAW